MKPAAFLLFRLAFCYIQRTILQKCVKAGTDENSFNLFPGLRFNSKGWQIIFGKLI